MDSATTAAFTGAAGATFFSSSSDHLFDDFNMHSTPTSSSDIDPIDHSTTFAGYDPMDLDMSRAMAGDPTSPYYDFFHTDHTSGSGGFDDGIGGSSFDDSFGSSSINDPFSNDI
ncbi:hypothetical protein FJM67_14915 [Maribrevibacterium harenarium]|uniref:Uncharacterized protein n=1 Tax=Maribrevibacterium harenarium TaxID=2589817 RepID=A0A501WEB9_9GAMM|nr:hypothetical protein [Maribrevibacterium harenarium]TPE47182.1 hypothetical protein FJM67_14915 [Maribrevibacterium harenarium]